MNRVICLYRVSTLSQCEKNDIPMQRIACRTFAERQGWIILQEYTEFGISGYKRSANQRDAIVGIREAAEAGAFDTLLVFAFDRIGRRDDETPFVLEWFSRHGISVWSVCEGEQRFDNHVDKLINYIRFWQASGESLKISERTRTRMRQLTKEGVYTGGNTPFGYGLIESGRMSKRGHPCKELYVLEKEAEIVHIIYEKSVHEGLGSRQIADEMNAAGFHTRAGKPWHHSSIRNILRNPVYTGVLRKGDAASSPLPHLAIIDTETFNLAQALHAAGKPTPGGRGAFLLSGLLCCAYCGATLGGTTSTKTSRNRQGEQQKVKRETYRCQHRTLGNRADCAGQSTYRASKVEAQFEQQFASFQECLLRQTPEGFADIRFHEILSGMQSERKKLDAEMRKVNHDELLLAREYTKSIRGNTELSADCIVQMQNTLNARHRALEVQLNVVDEQLRQTNELKEKLRAAMEKYQNLLRQYPSGTLPVKKTILAQLLQRVHLSHNYSMTWTLTQELEQLLNNSEVF